MTQFPVPCRPRTGGKAMLVTLARPKTNALHGLRLVAVILLGWNWAPACLAAVTAMSEPAARATPADAAGRQGAPTACPSLVDGRGATVRSRGTGGAAEASFARDCPAFIVGPAPVASPPAKPLSAKPLPAKQAKPPESTPGVRGLAAGSVQPVLDLTDDYPDGAPLVVRVTPERLTATVLTGGTTLWLLHSGFWTYLLILGLPLWRHVDLLPIVDPTGQDDERPAEVPATAGVDEERAVARVLRGQGRPRTGARERS
jgi:hypothetical protein